jgi:Pectate lyase superfamily protein
VTRSSILRSLVFTSFSISVATLSQPVRAASNFGETRLNVIAFGADNTGTNDSTASIQAAINSCDSTVGCEIYFPPGAYIISPSPSSTSSPILTIPSAVPITLAGAGQLSSVLEATPPSGSASVNADIIAVGTGSIGFTVHDLGVTVLPIPAGAIGGSIFHLTNATSTNFFNINVDGGYDIFRLGDPTMTTMVVQKTYVRAFNSQSGNHCFMRLDGGVSDTYVRGVFAEANNAIGSQIICTPSSQVNGSNQYPGVSGLHVVDSSFEGFTRGLSFAAAQFNLQNLFFDNLYLDTAANGPSFEVFVPPGSPSLVSNVHLSNSTIVSASTACVVHGSVAGVKLSNVTCDAGGGAYQPTGCMRTQKYPRGYALIEVSGRVTGAGSASVTVTPYGGTGITASVSLTLSESATNVANALGNAINTMIATGSCPPIIAPQQFADYNGSQTTHYSIGPDLELYSFQVGPTLTPSISATATPTSGIHVSVASGGTTFLPGDGIYVGSPTGTGPRNVVVFSTTAQRASSGVGLHLQGGSTLLFDSNHFGGAENLNVYGLQIDLTGLSYNDVQIQNNNLTNSATSAVNFNPNLAAVSPGEFSFSDNLGFDPYGAAPAPGLTCGAPFTNPFPFAAEVYISGTVGTVYKNSTQLYGASSSETVTVFLGIGENITINCTGGGLPAIQWYGE